MYTLDPLYLVFAVPPLLVALFAQILVRTFYNHYAKVANKAQVTGADVVEQIARKFSLQLRLNVSMQDLSDNYNPFRSELTLSDRVAYTPSVAAIGIAAHEMGHVLQHKQGSFLVSVRNFIIPAVTFGTTIGYLLFVLGISLQLFGVVLTGVALFSLSTVFTVITLPIEIDASLKALRMLRSLNIFSLSDIEDTKKVLFAAALTYVAAVLQSLSSLVYYLLRAFGVRRRE